MRLLGDFMKNFIFFPFESMAYVPFATTGVERISDELISVVSPEKLIRGKSTCAE